MQPAVPSESRVRRRKLPLEKRARSVPVKGPYIVALVMSACFYLALIGTTAALFAFMVLQSKNAAVLLIAFAASSAFLWFCSFLKRRNCRCPLCKGTPLLDNSAHRHKKALRFYPLNHGTSNVVRALVRQHFRCQYCGTPFDLLKPVSRRHVREQAPAPPTLRASQAMGAAAPPSPFGSQGSREPGRMPPGPGTVPKSAA